MDASDPVRAARSLFDWYRRGDVAAIGALSADDEAFSSAARVEATPHAFELISAEQVLVSGRLRLIDDALIDSPAWWLVGIRDGRWGVVRRFDSEADARQAVSLSAEEAVS